MPWMDDCTEAEWHTEESPLYKCTIEPGFWSVQKMLAWIIKYFTFLAWIGWVLFLVINGIMYSMWDKEEAKKRIIKTLTGLIILFSSWVILNLVAPWIYK
jgi:magnesium-transporting ATPase (P-type)